MATIPRFIPVTIVAQWLGCSKRHIYTLIHLGELEAINATAATLTQRSRALRVSRESVEKFITSRKVDPLKYAE